MAETSDVVRPKRARKPNFQEDEKDYIAIEAHAFQQLSIRIALYRILSVR